MNARGRMLILVAFILTCGTAGGDTIYVPDDYQAIQIAIYHAQTGDEIIVRPGTYVENIDFLGKAVTVRSEMGPAVTTIDGGSPLDPKKGSVVLFERNETRDSVIEGFTLINGTGRQMGFGITYGGGICCYRNCSPTIIGNVIVDCTAQCGGGICCFSYCLALIVDNTIKGCGSSAIYCVNSAILIEGNIICNNWAEENGGGIQCRDNSNCTIANNVIAGNDAVYGGGLFFWWSDCQVVNNTITANHADDLGAGICLRNHSRARVMNTILWSNNAPTGKEIYVGDGIPYPSVVSISYSDVGGGQDSVQVMSGCMLSWGLGMIDEDPLFMEPAALDFHITHPSPCRDRGFPDLPIDLEEDCEDDPRLHGASVDMGADEFHPHFYFFGDAVPGGNASVRVVGGPGTYPVTLGVSSAVREIPLQTAYGPFFLLFPIRDIVLYPLPSSGILDLPFTVPVIWPSGTQIAGQVLLGTMGSPGARLTNLSVLTVE